MPDIFIAGQRNKKSSKSIQPCLVIDVDYGYVNARIRGMKSRLLDRHTLEDLIFQPDLDSLISGLEKTPYKEDIIEAKVLYQGVLCIEYALRKNFIRTFQKTNRPISVP